MSLTRPDPRPRGPAPRPAVTDAGPARGRPLTEAEAQAYIHGICFKTGPPRRIGVELEWLVHNAGDPALPVEPHRIAEALSAPAAPAHPTELPAGALLTREPGGQVELSSLPAETLSECIESVRADLAALRGALAPHGLDLAGYGHDPWHFPRRVLELPRYAAMEEFFDRAGPAGRAMMCGTASVQICLDAGEEGPGPWGFARRWRLAHLLGPILVAAFANSPLLCGSPSGWRSTRQALWSRLDPSRTTAPPHGEPRAAWAAYALDAELLCIRRDGGLPWTAPRGTTFRQWINGSRRCRGEHRPTADDLGYHLTTLFPPVRPRGHLELRMIDAQPGADGWMVPVAVVAALFGDLDAMLTAETVAERLAVPGPAAPRNPLWMRAARHGLADPVLRRAAEVCFTAAEAALPRLEAPMEVRHAVHEFARRYVARGRCPADDLLDAVAQAPVPGRPRSGRPAPRAAPPQAAAERSAVPAPPPETRPAKPYPHGTARTVHPRTEHPRTQDGRRP